MKKNKNIYLYHITFGTVQKLFQDKGMCFATDCHSTWTAILQCLLVATGDQEEWEGSGQNHTHTQSHNLRLGSAACLTLKVVLGHTMENVESSVKAAVPGSNDYVFSIQF